MHTTSMATMKKFVEQYNLKDNCVVMDIGSYNHNGSYRELFVGSSTVYIGVDIIPGPNVDMIIDSVEWHTLTLDIDAIISGQTLEHVEHVPKLLEQIKKRLKPGGLLCIIAPSAGPPHDFPSWYRNYSVESMTEYVTDAGFEVISCEINPESLWCDCCCIAKKPLVSSA